MSDSQSKTYLSAGGIAITCTARPETRADAIDSLASALDERLGALFTSSFEYPGRYTRWDIGFCDPALSFTGRQRGFEVRACNERGAVLIPAVASALRDCGAVETIEADAHAVTGTVRASEEWFPEEMRSKQPTLFSVVRALIDLFRSSEDAHLGLYGAFGYELAFQFDPIRLAMPRDGNERNLALFLPDDILIVDHRREVATRYRYEFEVGGRRTDGLARTGSRTPYVAAGAVERMAVIGAGPMGGGIAQVAAYNDVPVRMKDIRHDAVAGGLAYARSVFDGAVRRRSLRPREAARRMGLISGGVDYSGVGRADVVIEAVVERLAVKEAVLREVEAVAAPGAVIASNTSSLSIDRMAAALEHPERFAGMHFFNPVHRMPLVEVVRGAKTDADTVETLAALAVRLGKVPVVTRDAPGFLVNRILGPCLNEAGHLLDEGWNARAVDRAWKDFGMPMGPFRLIDEVGIDVVSHAGNTMAETFGDRMIPAASLVALAESKRLGRKGGKGFYLYAKGKEKAFDPSVYADMRLSSARSTPDPEHVRDRLVLVMVNEAARVLEEGIVSSAADVDLGMVMGTGFPPFRGGLLKYADDRGVDDVARALSALRRTCGDRYEPTSLVVELARTGKTFHAAYPAIRP